MSVQEETEQIIVEQYQDPESRARLFELAFEIHFNHPGLSRLEAIEKASLRVTPRPHEMPAFTQYIATDDDKGFIKIFTLLDRGSVVPDSTVIEWYPHGEFQPAGREIWDAPDFIENLLQPHRELNGAGQVEIARTQEEMGAHYPRLVEMLRSHREQVVLRDPGAA